MRKFTYCKTNPKKEFVSTTWHQGIDLSTLSINLEIFSQRSQGSLESMSSTQSFHLSLYLSIFLPFSNFILAMIFENNSRMNNFRKRAAIESKLIAFMKFVVSYERTHILTHLEKEFETFESVQKALELIDEANLRRGSTKEIRRSYFEIFEWRSQWIL